MRVSGRGEAGGAGRARALVACCFLSLTAYATAAEDPAFQAMTLLAGGAALVVTSRAVGVRLPRWLIGLATLAVLGLTLMRTLSDGLGVHDFAVFLSLMIVVKLADRRGPGDDAQLLVYSVFLALASLVASNGLLVGAMTVVYLPLLVFSAMHLQLRLSISRARALASRGRGAVGVEPRVRAAAGSGSGVSLMRTAMVSIVVGLLFAAFVFVIVPRGAGLRQLGRFGGASAGRVVAFADQVRVGSGGAISQSRRPVLHLSVRSAHDERVGGEGAVQYLRGAALDRYEDGTWFASASPDQAGARERVVPGQRLGLSTRGGELTRIQEITLLGVPSDFSYLFTIWRPTRIMPLDGGEVAIQAGPETAMVRTRGGTFRYEVLSSVGESQSLRLSAREPASWPSPVVAALAEEILREAGVESDPARRPFSDDAIAIHAFRRFFWDRYTYSLGEPPPPPGVEPVEWFLTEADRGHCEHFAASLAALCRSVGIPARVVTGYVAAEYNAATESYTVRDSNAHAWVEAQREPGVWWPYDATPPASLLEVHGPEPGLMARAGRLLDALNYAWVNSIVSFDNVSRSQVLRLESERAEALTERADEALEALRRASVREIAALAVKIFVGIVGALLSVYGASVLVRRWLAARARRPRAIPRRIADPAARARVASTPIYQEMLVTLARAGRSKPEWQPPGAWAETLGPSGPGGADPRPAVRELTGLYYRMRFGGRELTAEERRRASGLLEGLRAELS